MPDIYKQDPLRIQTDLKCLNGQSDIVSIYEKKLSEIEDEFQTAIDTITVAMTRAVKNYEAKCEDFEWLSEQLNCEQIRNKSMNQQLNRLKNTIIVKDQLIVKLKQDMRSGEVQNLNEINQLKEENAELRKLLGINSTDCLSKIKEKLQPTIEKPKIILNEKSGIDELVRHIKLKLQTTINSMKSERENFALSKQKSINRVNEKKVTFDKFPEIVRRADKEIKPDTTERMKHKIDRVKSNQNSQSLTEENMAQSPAHKKCRLEVQLNEEKACKTRVKHELERILQKNRVVLDELNDAQKR